MKNFKQVMIKQDKLDKIFCNICGREVLKNKFGRFEDYLSINKIWEYDSEFDGSMHSFDICQDCYKNLLANMKIKP